MLQICFYVMHKMRVGKVHPFEDRQPIREAEHVTQAERQPDLYQQTVHSGGDTQENGCGWFQYTGVISKYF